jgi:hypothetical protein
LQSPEADYRQREFPDVWVENNDGWTSAVHFPVQPVALRLDPLTKAPDHRHVGDDLAYLGHCHILHDAQRVLLGNLDVRPVDRWDPVCHQYRPVLLDRRHEFSEHHLYLLQRIRGR